MPLAGYCSPISFPEEQNPSPSRARAAGKPCPNSICHSPSPVFSHTGTAAPGMFCLRVPWDVELFNDDVRLPSKGQLVVWTSPITDPLRSLPGRCFAPCCTRIFPRTRSRPALAVSSLWKNNREKRCPWADSGNFHPSLSDREIQIFS